MVMPGDNVNLEVELIAPIAMEEGQRFAIREGGRTVGAGVVTKMPSKGTCSEDHPRLLRSKKAFRPVAQLAERRSPKPQVGGSIPPWPAT